MILLDCICIIVDLIVTKLIREKVDNNLLGADVCVLVDDERIGGLWFLDVPSKHMSFLNIKTVAFKNILKFFDCDTSTSLVRFKEKKPNFLIRESFDLKF